MGLYGLIFDVLFVNGANLSQIGMITLIWYNINYEIKYHKS